MSRAEFACKETSPWHTRSKGDPQSAAKTLPERELTRMCMQALSKIRDAELKAVTREMMLKLDTCNQFWAVVVISELVVTSENYVI